ncbi:MAG: hypothetical protein R2711_18990 [Acidimicrobiales bacterium]
MPKSDSQACLVGQDGPQGVVEVVGPVGVESPSAPVDRVERARIVQAALGDEDGLPSGLAGSLDQLG